MKCISASMPLCVANRMWLSHTTSQFYEAFVIFLLLDGTVIYIEKPNSVLELKAITNWS